ncbi:mercuric reductase [Pasteurellaceae bacterium RH1A]|nr:mercuric reductase [Pasteurellaceae bacterium RH1A]
MLKKLLILLTLIPALALAEKSQNPTASGEKSLVLKVPEMTCQLCAYLVNKELREVEGVASTKASIKDRTVKVVAKSEVTNQALIQAVEKLHYSASVVQDESLPN